MSLSYGHSTKSWWTSKCNSRENYPKRATHKKIFFTLWFEIKGKCLSKVKRLRLSRFSVRNSKKISDHLLVCGPLKDLNDSKLILNESKLFPWSPKNSLVPFRTFRIFHKPVTGQELLFCRFTWKFTNYFWM